MLGSLRMSKQLHRPILIQPRHTQHVQFYPKRPVLARPGTKERSTPNSLQSSSRLAHVDHVDVISFYGEIAVVLTVEHTCCPSVDGMAPWAYSYSGLGRCNRSYILQTGWHEGQ